LEETRQLPVLAEVLVQLNGAGSPVWTSKVDVWQPSVIDPDELDAASDDAQHAMACYIDFLMRVERRWNSPVEAEQFSTALCARLREKTLRCCRVDLVMRRALIGSGEIGEGNYGIGATAYFTACGRSEGAAKAHLADCLAAFVAEVAKTPE
jgi:hypothetical protein